jgi:hypothetical protein
MTSPVPVLCHRCGVELTPGAGNFYVVCIEAFADPSPPIISEEDLARDWRKEMQRLIRKLRDKSGRELMDQVHRRLVIHLCGRCYPEWIEHPAG